MTNSSRKLLGSVLIGAAIITVVILRFCGVSMISFVSLGTAKSKYGYQHLEIGWLVWILLAVLSAGFYLVFRRSKN